MVTKDTSQIIRKFQELRDKEEQVFDISKLENKTSKEDIVFNAFFSFSNSLESEINALPKNPATINEIDKWVGNIDYWIRSRTGGKLSEITKIHLKYRKKLKTKLTEIGSTLINQPAELPQMEITIQNGKEKLTVKQQILLLESLGILKTKEIKSMPDSKKAILFSNLLNRGEKSVKDHLTYLNKSDGPPEFFIRKDDNTTKIKELLISVGLQ